MELIRDLCRRCGVVYVQSFAKGLAFFEKFHHCNSRSLFILIGSSYRYFTHNAKGNTLFKLAT